jgi:hypothetical protein
VKSKAYCVKLIFYAIGVLISGIIDKRFLDGINIFSSVRHFGDTSNGLHIVTIGKLLCKLIKVILYFDLIRCLILKITKNGMFFKITQAI